MRLPSQIDVRETDVPQLSPQRNRAVQIVKETRKFGTALGVREPVV